MTLHRLARLPTPPVQGHDTDAKRERNFALRRPLPRQIIRLRQLRRDFDPRVALSHSSLPRSRYEHLFQNNPVNCCFLDKPALLCTNSATSSAAICALMRTRLGCVEVLTAPGC